MSKHFHLGRSRDNPPSIETRIRVQRLLFIALGLMFFFGLWKIPYY